MKLFEGRASRLEFAKVFFLVIVVALSISALSVIDGIPENVKIILFIAFAVIGNFFLITAGVRRLHDFGRSGWWYLLMFVPIASVGLIIALLFMPGLAGKTTVNHASKDQ